jgi:hypothetical protein
MVPESSKGRFAASGIRYTEISQAYGHAECYNVVEENKYAFHVVRTFKFLLHNLTTTSPPLLITAKSGDLLITFAVHIRPNSGDNMLRGMYFFSTFFYVFIPPKAPDKYTPDQPTKSQWTYCSHLSNKAPLFETAIKLWPVAQVY